MEAWVERTSTSLPPSLPAYPAYWISADRPTPPTRCGARATAAAAPQPGRIPRSAIVAILAAVRRSTPVRVVPVN